jgi:hypothetical protein
MNTPPPTEHPTAGADDPLRKEIQVLVRALAELCKELNTAKTFFPGSRLQLCYAIQDGVLTKKADIFYTPMSGVLDSAWPGAIWSPENIPSIRRIPWIVCGPKATPFVATWN